MQPLACVDDSPVLQDGARHVPPNEVQVLVPLPDELLDDEDELLLEELLEELGQSSTHVVVASPQLHVPSPQWSSACKSQYGALCA